MPAKLTLHPPERASRFLVLRDGETLTVGREADNGLVLEDRRVSKCHARLSWSGTGWRMEDLGSKNGTFVNGVAARGAPLAGGEWLSFGGILGRFEAISEAEVSSLESDRLARLHTSIEMRRRLSADLDPFDFLLRFLESAIEVTRAERGFVLLRGAEGGLRVEVAAGFAPDDLARDRFAGSGGAIQRVLETRASVVASDATADPFLSQRPSVVGMGLGALACVPLRQEGEILGMIYVDGRQRAAGFAELDLEILESLADHAAIVVASLRLDRRVRELVRRPAAPQGADPALLSELQRRIAECVTGAAAASAGDLRAV
jgi:transcriptional regulator with GAF, ATPase, and Fis domain